MAAQHGIPGEWARVRGVIVSMWPLFVAFACFGAFLAAFAVGRHAAFFALSFVASLIGVAAMWRRGVRRVEAFFTGARGEERVANALLTLPDGWHVFHDLKAGRHHVDHVVVGATGAYAVETKNWRGRVSGADGRLFVGGVPPSRDAIAQTCREADAVKHELRAAGWEGTVTPVLCFASDSFADDVGEVQSVTVVNARRLAAWMASRPQVLAASEAERLVQLMETHGRIR